MQPSALPPDDRALLLQLEEAVNKHFYDGCDRITQALLAHCQWSIAVNLDMPILTITCTNAETYWSIVGNIRNISEYLSRVTRMSRIEVIPGDRKNIYFEVEIGA
ncbi:hypothetical protein H6G89_18000 [Oscillatoria sp. FACHB-1407]|uniref:hypothetical protein n=1 Tax=Oscillatoria sp. FACHB-1407 TaxID=2692847 RepID=UPI001687A18B|nr:hypothetical protein [Oscillatoria sp. FACHB-1407]MBD2462936.1 hypothetical protein [Oscillatoria sp. FACHB-1407]